MADGAPQLKAGMKIIGRLSLIYDLLTTVTGEKTVSLEALITHLDKTDPDTPHSIRTLRRDFAMLRHEFGIQITYNKKRNTYFVEAEVDSVTNIDAFNKLIRTTSLFAQAADLGRLSLIRALPISLEWKDGFIHYSTFIRDLTEAILKEVFVTINHQGYDMPANSYTVAPRMIIERERRWYLAAQTAKGQWRTYGLDRIVKPISISTNLHKLPTGPNLLKWFGEMVGVSELGKAPIEIELEFVIEQAPFERHYPIHQSFQELSQSNPAVMRSSYKVVNNYELRSRILAQGNRVRVISPQSLADQIAEAKA